MLRIQVNDIVKEVPKFTFSTFTFKIPKIETTFLNYEHFR